VPSSSAQGFDVQVVTGNTFKKVLRSKVDRLSEPDINLLTMYSIRGSKRMTQPGEMSGAPVDTDRDLIQVSHFERALNEVVNDLRRQAQ
jgi:hypothetical protein